MHRIIDCFGDGFIYGFFLGLVLGFLILHLEVWRQWYDKQCELDVQKKQNKR